MCQKSVARCLSASQTFNAGCFELTCIEIKMKSIKLPIPQNPTVQNFNKPVKKVAIMSISGCISEYYNF